MDCSERGKSSCLRTAVWLEKDGFKAACACTRVIMRACSCVRACARVHAQIYGSTTMHVCLCAFVWRGTRVCRYMQAMH